MHANQATYANAPIEASREIPNQLQRLREAIGELGCRSDLLLARTESVRRIPPPAAVSTGEGPGPIRAVPQTPIGNVLDEMTREIESQIRSVNHAIDTLELA
ncbi:hypothetical protein QMO14_16965 [Variovorax sp. CAN2819]|uniref:hypothetical protein n=1 Tax=Variovorax sp. CAN15 TaxID=3046727 RepID=UPI0026478AC8|nr:hypothetical protein [Variovorax sp. CAN15]MDN6885299.1 hypothetical protein [Variovorax sp. CAN15]